MILSMPFTPLLGSPYLLPSTLIWINTVAIDKAATATTTFTIITLPNSLKLNSIIYLFLIIRSF
jgi:hypothetical protein